MVLGSYRHQTGPTNSADEANFVYAESALRERVGFDVRDPLKTIVTKNNLPITTLEFPVQKTKSKTAIVDDQIFLEYLNSLSHLRLDGRQTLTGFPSEICLKVNNRVFSTSKIQSSLDHIHTKGDQGLSRSISQLVNFIVPLESSPSIWGRGTTYEPLRGVIFIGVTDNPEVSVTLSTIINICHEYSHLVFSLIRSADQLVQDKNDYCYSGIRQIERPAILAFHGLYALTYMRYAAQLFEDVDPKSSRLFLAEINQMSAPAIKALSQIKLTQIGTKIFTECSEFLSS